jgi:hypothetical protein
MIEFQSITNDGNGNPRYVIDFYHILTEVEQELPFLDRYPLAIKKANKIGGRKFHNKQYGGGLVFSTYNLASLEKKILEIAK